MLDKLDFEKGEVLLIDKPLYWTSFDLVNKLRLLIKHRLGIKKIKVGHAGTLDPLATGLAIVCTGKKTKEIDLYQAKEKEYIATIKFGATTPSFDLETEIDQTFEYSHITEEKLVHTLQTSFTGEIIQIPPVFSAKKINGKRAYEKARQGLEVEVRPHQIFIKEIELLKFDLPEIVVRIVCSKGTYIRSLARDFGLALNSGAHLTALRRTKIGELQIEKAITVPELEKFFQVTQ